MKQTKYYRTIWISDLHLGTRACKADALVDFLRSHIAETLYLVGDIVDGWNWGPAWHWSDAQAAVANEIARWRHEGSNVIFIPGNHDEAKSDLVERVLGSLPSVASVIHRTLAGAKMLVIHGHQFDGSLNPNRLLSVLGTNAYARARLIHDWYQREGEPPREDDRSLADRLRHHTKRAIEFLTDFRDRAILAAARDHKADGVICGHIHRSEYRQIGNVLYVNDGDWVSSRTAVVEESSGALQIVRWNHPLRDSSVSESVSQEAAS